MVDKNPYENDEVNVPNFGETEEKGVDPIFNMDTTNVTSETDSYDAEEEAESSSKLAIIILIVFLVLFLAGAVAGLLYGFSKAKEVNTIKEESTAMQAKYEAQINELNTKVSELEVALEQAKTTPPESTSSEGGSSSQTTTSTAIAKYSMQDGVSVRTGAGTNYGIVNYDKLPNDVKDLVVYDQATKAVTTRNKVFPIYETKQNGTQNWGRIADNAWICIDYGTKQ